VTPTELRVFLAQTKRLFPRSPWEPDEWDVFAGKMQHHPASIASQAIIEHRAETNYKSPSIPGVLAQCKRLRMGPVNQAEPRESAERNQSDVLAELRWCWDRATSMYGDEAARRVFARREGPRSEAELARLGLSQDQIDEVIRVATGGEVTDSFRGDRARLPRPQGSGQRPALVLPSSGGHGVPSGVHHDPEGHARSDVSGDHKVAGASVPLDSDNDLQPGEAGKGVRQ